MTELEFSKIISEDDYISENFGYVQLSKNDPTEEIFVSRPVLPDPMFLKSNYQEKSKCIWQETVSKQDLDTILES